jgi:nucleotide-binding universal stress UspA family protein
MTAAPLTILVPIDGSALAAQALPYARKVAADHATLVLLRVLSVPEPIRDAVGRTIVPVDDAARWSEDAARTDLEAVAAENRQSEPDGVRFITEVRTGDPAETILRVASERAADLIVIASHGRGAVGRVAFGSVADRVARAAQVPVMIVRPLDAPVEISPAEIRRVVVPLDGSDLAAHALPTAESLARRLHLPIVLVRAIDAAEAYGLLGDALITDVVAMANAERDAGDALESAATELRAKGLSAAIELRIGPAFAAIADTARPGDVVVLSSHGRRGVTRWLLGSVAEKLVRDGPAPVILVPVGARATEKAVVRQLEPALADRPAVDAFATDSSATVMRS